MENRIEIFVELGRRLRHFGEDERSKRALQTAIAENEWFTHTDILRAIDAICEEYLDRETCRVAQSISASRTITQRSHYYGGQYSTCGLF